MFENHKKMQITFILLLFLWIFSRALLAFNARNAPFNDFVAEVAIETVSRASIEGTHIRF